MVWGWLVSWGSLVGWLVFWVVWFTRVGNIGNESTITIRISGVGDSLDTSIGKVDRVGSSYSLGIGCFSSLEVSSGVVISYTIFENVWLWGFVISWSFSMISWSRGVIWSRGWVVWSWVVWGWGSSWG